MSKIGLEKDTPVKFFLNSKTIILLQILSMNSHIFSNFFLKKISENNLLIVKSQFYKYIDTLKEYHLIQVGSWKKTSNGTGYTYNITEKGVNVLNFLTNNFD